MDEKKANRMLQEANELKPWWVKSIELKEKENGKKYFAIRFNPVFMPLFWIERFMFHRWVRRQIREGRLNDHSCGNHCEECGCEHH